MGYSITGIQQIGIGVEAVEEAWRWYRKQFGMDVPIFRDAGEATLMAKYTGGEGRKRIAVLAMSMHGGGSFEVWQFTDRKPEQASEKIVLGDLGIFAAVIKSCDIAQSFAFHQEQRITLSDAVETDPVGLKSYLVQDPYGNSFRIEESAEIFLKTNRVVGGVKGAIIGVSEIDGARKLYSDILGYGEVLYDEEGVFDDFSACPGGTSSFRRVKLTQGKPRKGGLSRVFGLSFIELIQVKGRAPVKIFQDRYWGDRGFIHLCFDVYDTDSLKIACERGGFPFTVDSQGTFEMGAANGRFAYTEDPDGTLIELVEVFKLPLIEKLGWYLDMKKRDPEKPIPNWMLKSLRFSRVKDR